MLSLHIFDTPTRLTLYANYSQKLTSLSFGTNKHGFSSMNATIEPLSLYDAFAAYNWPGLPHVVVSDHSAGVIWEGRLEDITIVDGGIALEALGYQRAMWDVPYTALWSKTSTADWKPQSTATITPERYEMDNNNRLFIAPRKGETINDDSHYGDYTWAVPYLSVNTRPIATFSCDYSQLLPTNWKFEVYTVNEDYSSGTLENTVTGNGSTQTGSLNLTTAGKARLVVRVHNDTGGNVTVAGDTGATYVKLTNLRVKSTTSSTVLASDIAAALVAYVAGINSDQISTATAFIEATTTDLQDEIYEDELPADILDRLALLHGYEWGVYENRMLYFRTKGSAGRQWYVDATRIVELQRSIEPLRNSAYATYRDASGRTLRTASSDSVTIQRYGITRRGVVDAQTTSGTEAGLHRDYYLNDRKEYSMRARIEFSKVYDAAGSEWPLYMMRAGDVVTIRNLPPTLSTSVDRIRTFIIGETDYDAAKNEINIAPYEPVPTLVTLLARRDAGL